MPFRPALLPGRAAVVALLACVLAAGCAMPADGAPGAPPSLLVLNAGDATLSRVPTHGTRQAQAAASTVQVPPGPWQLAAGPGAGAAVVSLTPEHRGAVLLASATHGGWATTPVTLAARGEVTHIASDGQFLVAALRTGDGPVDGADCQLALIDPTRAVVRAAHTVCASGEAVLSLALATSRTGDPIAYLGVWRDPIPASSAWSPDHPGLPGGRIVALDPVSGVALRSTPVDVVPTELAVVPVGADGSSGPDGQDALGALPHLLCACGAPDRTRIVRDGVVDAVSSWRVLDLDADTLEPVASYAVTAQPHALQAAPDGGTAYALVGGLDVGSRAALVHLDLRGAGPRTLAELPGRAAGLAVAGQYVYVPHLDGHVVWAVDRLRGRVVETLSVGRRPLAVAVSVGT